MRRIGIYGGTFDPVHCAHLILAREAQEQFSLEKVLFVPAAISPHKDEPVAPGKTRLLMLQVAIDGENGFAVDECELRRPPPSYSMDTVEEIRGREGASELYFLIGEDNVSKLSSWHRFEELRKLVTFVVLNRTNTTNQHPYQVVQRQIDISATDIRKRVASGRSIRYLVPPMVEQIIRQNNLYRE